MFVKNQGCALHSELPVIVFKTDCFGTDSPAELVSHFPRAYAIFRSFVKSKVLVPGEIIPVRENDKTVIIALTKFTSRFIEEPEDIRDCIVGVAKHCAIYAHEGVAFANFPGVEENLDQLEGLSVESWVSATSSSMTSAS